MTPCWAVLDRLDCAAGGELIEQGDRSDALLYIAAGRVEVQLELPDGRVIRVRAYEAGTLVGEIAFYTGASARPRSWRSSRRSPGG